MMSWLGSGITIAGLIAAGAVGWTSLQLEQRALAGRVSQLEQSIAETREAQRRLERVTCLICESVRGEAKCPLTCEAFRY